MYGTYTVERDTQMFETSTLSNAIISDVGLGAYVSRCIR